MSTPHPTIQYFADTVSAAFPLILVIGREPNTDRPIADTIGPYDFRDAPRCGFWNTSYAMLGELVGHHTRELKQRCVEQHGSPLLYADALPHGLLNQVGDKTERRNQLSPKAVSDHVARIFSHRVLLDRVRLVILSGLDAPQFQDAKASIREHCMNKGIHVIEVPFFFGTNTNKIARSLTPNDRDALIAIWRAFDTAEGKQ